MSSNSLTDQKAFDFLRTLFPKGLKDPTLITELCPEGWEKSPLFECFHPSPKQKYQEHLAFTKNLHSITEKIKKNNPDSVDSIFENEATLSFEEFLAKYPQKDTLISLEATINEPAELLGLCLWDVFSDNHDVIAADGLLVDLGSFRGSASTISDFFESNPPNDDNEDEDGWWGDRGMGYADFYMGTSMIRNRADLTPAYQLIFRRLKFHGADWAYSFPHTYLIDCSEGNTDTENYDPSASLEREREIHKMQKQLDQATLSAKREARVSTPPATVRAYQTIFGKFPQGWPPDPYSID